MAHIVVDPHGHSAFGEEVVEQGSLAKGYTHRLKTKAMCGTSKAEDANRRTSKVPMI